MKRSRIVLLSALFLLVSAGSFGAGIWLRAVPAQAQSEAAQQWEYCALSRTAFVGSQNRPGTYWISYFNADGARVETFQETATERNGMAKAIAKLGTQGWELVATGKLDVRAGDPIDAMYFKRPKR
jgi:hypothetical protein